MNNLPKTAKQEIMQRYWINEDKLELFITMLKDHNLYDQFLEYYKLYK